MASALEMSFLLTPREEIDAGSSQTHSVIDSVAQKTYGGSISKAYTSHTTDASSKIVIYESAKCKYDALGSGTTDLASLTWATVNHASYVTRGALPTNINVLAVEFIEAAGTVNTVSICFGGSAVLVTLSEGEGVVIPATSKAQTDFDIFANVADDDTNFARVNVLVAGT